MAVCYDPVVSAIACRTMIIAYLLILTIIPAVSVYLCKHFKLFNKLGTAATCFLGGTLLGQLVEFLQINFKNIANNFLTALVAIAIPMLLYSCDLKSSFHLAGKTFTAMILAMLSVVIAAVITTALMNSQITHLPEVASMAVGIFTGSLLNGAAVKTALQIPNDLFLLVYGYDVLTSSLYLLLLISFAHRIAKMVLTPFQCPSAITPTSILSEYNQFLMLKEWQTWKGLFFSLVVTVLIITAALALSELSPQNWKSAVAVVVLTILSLIASLHRRLHSCSGNWPLGMYLILLFCTVSGTFFNESLFEQATVKLLGFFATIVFGSMALHLVLCKLFRIDADTFLVTSVASILSPPFVPLAAGVMHNQSILVTGISAGVLGYGAGNLLGIATFWILTSLV